MVACFAAFMIVVAVAHAQTVCDQTGGGSGSYLLGCQGGNYGGTNVCAYSNDTAASNCCIFDFTGAGSYCAPHSATVGLTSTQFQCYTPVVSNVCPKNYFNKYSGGTGSGINWTCNNNAACTGASFGATTCVYTPPSPAGYGQQVCAAA